MNGRNESTFFSWFVFTNPNPTFVTQLTVIDWKLFSHERISYISLHSRIHFKIEINSVVTTVKHFPPQEMATLWNKRKLAAASIETQEHLRNSQSQNTSVLGITEEYIRKVSEGRFSKKLSQEFSRTEYQILGALSKLDEFLLNPVVRTLSGTVPGTSWNNDLENWESTMVRSKNDPSQSGVLCLSNQQFGWLWPGRDLSQPPISNSRSSQCFLKRTVRDFFEQFLQICQELNKKFKPYIYWNY